MDWRQESIPWGCVHRCWLYLHRLWHYLSLCAYESQNEVGLLVMNIFPLVLSQKSPLDKGYHRRSDLLFMENSHYVLWLLEFDKLWLAAQFEGAKNSALFLNVSVKPCNFAYEQRQLCQKN